VGAATALSLFPHAIRKALAIDAHRDTGTLKDVAHIVILTQENRSFDHYFGSLKGVRGFGDRFPIPMHGGNRLSLRQVWQQSHIGGPGSGGVHPFHLDTLKDFKLMRTEGAAHTWPDAQQAWADGKLDQWTQAKGHHAMGYFAQADLPFHYALADAFTLCDAYHCSFQGGTTPNRLFLWTGTNDPHGRGQGPATFNDLESLQAKLGRESYTWTTYPERLQAAGISWQVYQNIDDNYDDNSLAFFKVFRDAYADLPGSSAELKARASSTRNLDQLEADVMANKLPQVSWIVANELSSEHPGQSSPAQGADYTARVLAALTANPEVWSRTVFILNYDENDGFFDHMPPPAVPSYITWNAHPAQSLLAGASTVDTAGEYHENLVSYRNSEQDRSLLHRPYGLGPRVPMLVISPWSRGGWVNSQVFDHTSVIRLIEKRFGVIEPNISPWRRAVCGDLTSTLDFTHPDKSTLPQLPATAALAARARALAQRSMPLVPDMPPTPVAMMQASGTRRSRALPYQLHVHSTNQPAEQMLQLTFVNSGTQAAVFHVYDRLNLDLIPRRYTVEHGQRLADSWALVKQNGAYDLWLLGPNGFHRHFTGQVIALPSVPRLDPEIEIGYNLVKGELIARLCNRGHVACTFELQANAYFDTKVQRLRVAAQREVLHTWPLKHSGYWYDFTLRVPELAGFSRRFAGRMETGEDSVSDPAMGAGRSNGLRAS
jgi:phospholipase C